MKTFTNLKKLLIITAVFISYGISGFSAVDEVSSKCVDCFSTTISTIERSEDCITITLLIEADENCKFGLSHFMVAIPCGTVTHAENSGKWRMELMVTDPTTGIRGLKVDDIKGFGESNKPGSFTLTYTVCSADPDCLDAIQNGVFNLSYKAGQCVFYEDITPEIVDPQISLEAEVTGVPVSCYGSLDGAVYTVVKGGLEPYSYLWNSSSVNPSIENVGVGNYSVVITDARGEQIELFAEVVGPSPILVAGKLTHANCSQSTGAIELTVTGGSGDYTYVWAHGAETKDVAALSSGSYQVTVTDSKGCVVKMPFFITALSPIQMSSKTNTPECHETASGNIEIEIWGGTEPYSFIWSNGATTQNLTGVNTGSYRVTITDTEGCKLVRTVFLQRKIFYVIPVINHADCSGEGGSVVLNPQNGSGPYVAEWSTGDIGMELDGLPVGTHTVIVTDGNGCRISQQITINATNVIHLNASVSAVNCDPTQAEFLIDLSASGGTLPYIYYLNGEVSQASAYVNGEGDYHVEVIDANGCNASETINVTSPESILEISITEVSVDCDNPGFGSVAISISGGVEPYEVFWNGESVSGNYISLPVGTHQIRVVDALGCESATEVLIEETVLPSVSIIENESELNCKSINNQINAVVVNGESFHWTLESESSNWVITSETLDQMLFNAGNGSAKVTLTVYSSDGCEASDSVVLSCQDSSGDENPGDDGNKDPGDDNDPDNDNGDGNSDNDNDADNDGTEHCILDCISLESIVVSEVNGCKRYNLKFVTNGDCRYELSHMVIDLNGYYPVNVSNSRKWKMEINSKDPKSGLTGIKIDDISGFGKMDGDSFTVSFELCDADDFDASSFRIAYKAGTCLEIVETGSSLALSENVLQLVVYPNPVISDVWFEFVSSVDTNGNLVLYNEAGIQVATLFNGKMKRGLEYRVKYSGSVNDTMIMFYQFNTDNKRLEGKILRIK